MVLRGGSAGKTGASASQGRPLMSTRYFVSFNSDAIQTVEQAQEKKLGELTNLDFGFGIDGDQNPEIKFVSFDIGDARLIADAPKGVIKGGPIPSIKIFAFNVAGPNEGRLASVLTLTNAAVAEVDLISNASGVRQSVSLLTPKIEWETSLFDDTGAGAGGSGYRKRE